MQHQPLGFVGPYRLIHFTERRRGYEDWLAVAGAQPTRLYRLETAATIEPYAGRALIQQGLSHPNLVEGSDLGYGDEGVTQAGWRRAVYVGTPRPMGPTITRLALSAKRSERRIPLGVILNIISQAARGVEHGHLRTGMAHGRIDPREIYVEPSGRVRVGGFGGDAAAFVADKRRPLAMLAQATHERVDGRDVSFSLRELDYASPEHILGEQLCPASDVFSLGIILYEFITVRRILVSPSVAELYRRMFSTRPRPSEFVLDLPTAVDAVVERALSRKAENRYESAEAFACALDALAMELGEDSSNEAVARAVQDISSRDVAWLRLQLDSSRSDRPLEDTPPEVLWGEREAD